MQSTTLSKNQLSFLAESTALASIRPRLQYIYYIPGTKRIASTDSFRLHEIEIDLGPDRILFDTKGNVFAPSNPNDYKFPDYESFFHTPEQAPLFPALIDIEILKSMDYHMKPYNHNSIINFKSGSISNNKKYHYNNIRTLDIEMTFQKLTPPTSCEHDIGININYLYNSLRYLDKPSKKQDTPIKVQSKNELSPLIIHGLIDNAPARALIMPLKI